MVERLHVSVEFCAGSAEAGPDRQLLVLKILIDCVLIPPRCGIHQSLPLFGACTIFCLQWQAQEHLSHAELPSCRDVWLAHARFR